MKVKFFTTDGSETVAATPSLALTYWLAKYVDDTPLPPNLPPLTVIVGKATIPSPYSENFLEQIVEHCEQNFGGKPPITPQYYPELGKVDFRQVESLYKTDERIRNYEDTCIAVLRWLEKHGDLEFVRIEMEEEI